MKIARTLPWQYLPLAAFAAGLLILIRVGSFPGELARPYGYKVRVGDEKAWSQPDLDDHRWAGETPTKDALWWERARVDLKRGPDPFQPLAVSFQVSASYELYWDGALIGVNGKVGRDAGEEVPGQFYRVFPIPNELATVGTHLLAFRFSSFDGNPLSMDVPRIGDSLALYRGPLVIVAFMHLLGGMFLVIGLYHLFIYFISSRKAAQLIFALICFSFLALMLMEYLRYYLHYAYPFQITRLRVINAITLLIALLLPIFMLFRFDSPGKKHVVAALAVSVGVIWLALGNPDLKTLAMAMISFLFSLGITIHALRRHKKGAHEMLLGILACLMGLPFYSITLFVGFGLMVVYILISLSIDQREERNRREKAVLHAAGLETQLLKNKIRPHFLMNTLTSLITWVEESPKVATEFIQALGKEFSLLTEVSDQKEIPIATEIALCENLLKIMSLRQESAYRLECRDIDWSEKVPPALFHTLIENGVTHQRSPDDPMTFELSYRRDLAAKTYTLLAAEPIKSGQRPHDPSDAVDGTGLKYVKARLQERFPHRWSLEAGPTDSGWRTAIRIEMEELP